MFGKLLVPVGIAQPRGGNGDRAEGINGVPDSFSDKVLKWTLPLAVAAITRLADYFLTKQPRLVYFATDVVRSQIGDRLVHTQTLAIQNIGQQSAQHVTVYHNWEPEQVCVWPLSESTVGPLPGGQHAVVLDFIRPRETTIITYTYGTPPSSLPVFSSVSIKEHVAKQVDIPLAPRYPAWITTGAKILVFIGIFFVSFYAYRGLLLAWRNIRN